jgi:PASTA domain
MKKNGSLKKLVVLLAGASLLLVTLAMLIQLVVKYDSSKQWEKPYQPELASLSPEMLYLSDVERANVGKYVELKNQLWDEDKGDFKDGVSQSSIDELTSAHDVIKQISLTGVHELFDVISKAWNVQSSIQSSLSEKTETVVDKSDQLKLIIDNEFDTLNELSLTTKANHFVERTYNDLKSYAKEYNVLTTLYEKIEHSFYLDKSKNTLYVRTSAKESDRSEFRELSSSVTSTDLTQPLMSWFNDAKQYLEQNDKGRFIEEKIAKETSSKEQFEKLKNEAASAQKEFDKLVVDYPNLVNKSREDVEKWAKDNQIKVTYKIVRSSIKKGNVVTQAPSASSYKKITKGSSITVEISDNDEPTTQAPTTQSTPSTTTRRSR